MLASRHVPPQSDGHRLSCVPTTFQGAPPLIRAVTSPQARQFLFPARPLGSGDQKHVLTMTSTDLSVTLSATDRQIVVSAPGPLGVSDLQSFAATRET